IALPRAALLLAAAACASPAGAPRAAAVADQGAVDAGLQRLDEALRLREDQSLWEQVAPAASEAAAQLLPAAKAGLPRAAAGLAAARVLSGWQVVCESRWTLEGDEATPAVREAWGAAREATAKSLLRWLESGPGDVPAAFTVRATLALEIGRDDVF